MKKQVPLMILEEKKKKKIATIKNTLYWIVVVVLIVILLNVGIDSVIVNKEIEKYSSKVRSTLQTGPIQRMLGKQEKIELKGVEITKLATYDITGTVIGMEFFYFGDNADKISKQDLTLTWGPASAKQYTKDIKVLYSANDRFASIKLSGNYWDKYKEKGGNYISNNHIIPLNNTVKNTLRKVKKGDTVQMLGWLVYCKGEDWTWGPSSLVRTDRGNGACEIVLVEYLSIMD